MSLSRRLPPLTVLAVALASAALPAAAQQGRGPRGERPPPEPTRSQRDDSVSDAVRRIERSNRGQVLSAERMQYDGRDVTRIKVVDDAGRVRIYMDDAQPNPDPRRQVPRNGDNPSRQHKED
ncbi:MAG: PepSY domain-containing protein [Lysobacter sp.]|nr:PepSY domain-containing protein [Lysobacter sp.]